MLAWLAATALAQPVTLVGCDDVVTRAEAVLTEHGLPSARTEAPLVPPYLAIYATAPAPPGPIVVKLGTQPTACDTACGDDGGCRMWVATDPTTRLVAAAPATDPTTAHRIRDLLEAKGWSASIALRGADPPSEAPPDRPTGPFDAVEEPDDHGR